MEIRIGGPALQRADWQPAWTLAWPAPATALAMFPDGRRVALGGRDGAIAIATLGSDAPPTALAGHTGCIRALRVLDGGARLLSASWDATLRIWDVDGARALHVLEGHDGGVTDTREIEAGRAVSSSWDGTLRTWDLAKGALLSTLSGHDGPLSALDTDGRFAASAAPDGVRAWALGETPAARWATPLRRVTAVLCAGPQVIAATSDGRLHVLDEGSGRVLRLLEGHRGPVTVLRALGGARVLSAGWDASLRVWDPSNATPLHVCTDAVGPIFDLCLHPDGRRAVALDGDGTARVWDLEEGRPLQLLRLSPPKYHERAVVGVPQRPRPSIGTNLAGTITTRIDVAPPHPYGVLALTPDGRRAVGSSLRPTVTAWDLRESLEPAPNARSHWRWVRALAVTPEGDRIVSCGDDAAIGLWDPATGGLVARLTGHRGIIWTVVFPTPERAASAGDDGTIRLWDLREQRAIAVLTGHADSVDLIALAKGGELLVSASRDGTLRTWDARDETARALLEPIGPWARSLAVLDASGLAVTTSLDDHAIVWDLRARVRARDLPTGEKSCHLFVDPDGLVWTLGMSGRLVAWDAATGAQVRELAVTGPDPWRVGFSSDRRRLAVCDRKHVVRVIDLATAAIHASLPPHDELVSAAAFDGSGTEATHLWTADGERVRRWDLAAGTASATLTLDARVHTLVALGPGRVAAGDAAGDVRILRVEDA